MSVMLTRLSQAEYCRLSSGRMTPKMAAEYLMEGQITLRSFGETLAAIYPHADLSQRLINAFLADGTEKPDSVSRKVRLWLSGQNKPSDREDLFRIAFALGLNPAQASLILGICTDYGIHYRNGRDVIYAWFLKNGKAYQDARAFYESLPKAPPLESLSEGLSPHLTQMMRDETQLSRDEDELRENYIRNLPHFGTMHLRAYAYFEKYLGQLIHPTSAWGEEDEADYSLESVMEEYFSLKMPSGKKRSGYSVVQKLIKANWPNTTALKNIRAHKLDVPRKVLLLLYVITENIMDDAYHESDEDYLTLEERLEDHWMMLNSILSDCGMPLLDPRNASDWLVLYAITAQEEAMSERMEQVIELMFAQHAA